MANLAALQKSVSMQKSGNTGVAAMSSSAAKTAASTGSVSKASSSSSGGGSSSSSKLPTSVTSNPNYNVSSSGAVTLKNGGVFGVASPTGAVTGYSGGRSNPTQISYNAAPSTAQVGASGGSATPQTITQKFNIAKKLDPTLTYSTFVSQQNNTETEEEKKRKKALADATAATAPATGRINFLDWKKTNPTGTYSQWKVQNDAAKIAQPTLPGQPEIPKPIEIQAPINEVPPELPPEVPADNTILNANGDLQSQLNAIQSEYLASMTPATEEQNAQAQLDKELAALSQGLVDVEGQPIALPFITGQQSALEKRSLARQVPLSQALARLQALRQTKGNIASAKLGFAQKAMETQASTEQAKLTKEQKDFENQVLLATKGLIYDPATKTFSQSATGGLLDPQQKANLEEGLRTSYLSQSKDYQTVRNYYQRMLAVSQDPSAAGDIALVFSYMKVLDPTSVVREGEFATAANAGSVPDAVRNMWNRLLTGERLGANRQDFITQGTNIYNSTKAQNDALAKEFTRIAQNNGVNASNVIVDLNPATNYSTTVSSANTSAGGNVTVKGPDGKYYSMTPEDAQLAVLEGGVIVQ